MKQHITIVGAGLTGSLLAIFLAKRGYHIDIYEQRSDPRESSIDKGRSINLALSARGLYALAEVGLMQQVTKHIVPMKGRIIHPISGELRQQSFGRTDDEYLGAISRLQLNIELLNAIESYPHANLHFSQKTIAVDVENRMLTLSDQISGQESRVHVDVILAADGAPSMIRQALFQQKKLNFDKVPHECSYKELSIRHAQGKFLEKNYLHLWPRQSFLMIANPNVDDSFTCTLFLPEEGQVGFHLLKEESDVNGFFKAYFPDLIPLMPNLIEDFFSHPINPLATIKGSPWFIEDKILLLGDAAHAITPFFGQGANAGFEDCTVFNALLDKHENDWEALFKEFFKLRKPNTDAVADMALDNYDEICTHIADTSFLNKKKVEWELMRRFPNSYIAKNVLVMFERVPYQYAQILGNKQQQLIDKICARANNIDDLDWNEVANDVKEYDASASQLISNT